MKYSIIIPTLNEEKLLPVLLEQIVNNSILESYDAEIIISDGGSRDKTIEVAKAYPVKTVEHKGKYRQTIAEGRNSGAAEASGEVLVFLDSDIVFENVEFFFERVNDLLASNKYLAMTCYIKISPDERKLSDIIFLNFYNWYFRILNNIGVGMGRGECQIIPKKIFDEMNGYNTNLVAGEDFDLFKRIRKHGKILFDKKLVIYESPRRYRKYGHVKIFFTWLVNALSVMLVKKSFTNEWEEVR